MKLWLLYKNNVLFTAISGNCIQISDHYADYSLRTYRVPWNGFMSFPNGEKGVCKGSALIFGQYCFRRFLLSRINILPSDCCLSRISPNFHRSPPTFLVVVRRNFFLLPTSASFESSESSEFPKPTSNPFSPSSLRFGSRSSMTLFFHGRFPLLRDFLLRRRWVCPFSPHLRHRPRLVLANPQRLLTRGPY